MSNKRTKTIIVTGGIGVGKSVVCRILSVMGYEVYDSDSGAKHIMDNSDAIKRALVDEFGPEVVHNGTIRRDILASIVFSDTNKLERLNAIVHPVVINSIADMIAKSSAPLYFVETAIPRSSGLAEMADAIWLVEAPVDIRVKRVGKRSGLTPQQVQARIDAQRGEFDVSACGCTTVRTIINDGTQMLLSDLKD
jgi:dephospho-CoA kinase